MKLVIVESPAKARTIEKFLGKDYHVVASYGHIRDLPGSAAEIPKNIRDREWARFGVDYENDFSPVYIISPTSKKQVAALRKEMKKADELLLATDQDREGEAISWHLIEVLKPTVPVRRITFHEITKEAIQRALAEPTEIDMAVVRAQESRRILDRLFGYSLSPVLWKKVRTKLSAGRVQSVAVRLIVEREEERQAFRVAEYWSVESHLDSDVGRFSARLRGIDDKKLARGKDFDADTGELKKSGKLHHLGEAEAKDIAERCLKALPWTVETVDQKEKKQRPRPPFSTSTLQQAASSLLGMSPKRTMMVAQRLYEGVASRGAPGEGLITYMRTDSLSLSERALSQAEGVIRKAFGPEYTDGPRRYRTKAKGAQEAHEAIRPTDLSRTPDDVAAYLERDELELYRLIWSRTIASQMADARVDKTAMDFTATIDDRAHRFRANGSVIRFPGYLRVMGNDKSDARLPDLAVGATIGLPTADAPGKGDSVVVEGAEPKRHETSPPARYTEAALVRKLEEEGIGRPSTYAPTISVIQAREYVFKKSGALVPSYVGIAVVHLLREHFQRFVNVEFTASMEKDLDEIAAGKVDWRDFLRAFYHGVDDDDLGLSKRIEEESPNIEYPHIPLGKSPASGLDVTVRIGRTYVYVQEGTGEEASRATLPVDLLIDELTLEKALELIEQRRKSLEPIGKDPGSGENVYKLVGPYGPYVQLGEVTDDSKPKRVSLPKGRRLEDVDLAEALKLLQLPRIIGIDPETEQRVTAGIGRFGPYVERARVYVSLKDPAELWTIGLEDAVERINNKNKKEVLKELGTHPETGEPLNVLKGRWGPFVTDGTVNANIGRDADLESFTAGEALELLKAAAARKKTKKKTTRKKTAKKKVAKKKTTKKKAVKKKAPAKKPVSES